MYGFFQKSFGHPVNEQNDSSNEQNDGSNEKVQMNKENCSNEIIEKLEKCS